MHPRGPKTTPPTSLGAMGPRDHINTRIKPGFLELALKRALKPECRSLINIVILTLAIASILLIISTFSDYMVIIVVTMVIVLLLPSRLFLHF